MRKNLHAFLMAGLTATTFLTMVCAPRAACAASGITVSTDENGRKIYINGDGPAKDVRAGAENRAPDTSRSGASAASSSSGSSSGYSDSPSVGTRSGLMYWSSKERRFKPVPTSGAVMRAARSAASEVNTYLDGRSGRGPETAARSSLNIDFGRSAFSQSDIDAAIERAAARHNVDPNLVRSVIKVESNFNPNAVSRKGAMGLMQLMPATARSLNVSNPFDPQQNVDAGVRHLKRLLENYGGDVRLSLAAYNAGSKAVARSAGVPRFAETRNYVRRITDLYAGGEVSGTRMTFSPVHDPVRVERDARGVLMISNTE